MLSPVRARLCRTPPNHKFKVKAEFLGELHLRLSINHVLRTTPPDGRAGRVRARLTGWPNEHR